MKYDVLKRSHLKRNIIIALIVVGMISAIVLNLQEQSIEQQKVCHYLMEQ